MSNESNNSSFRVPGLAETLIKSLYVAKDEIIKSKDADIQNVITGYEATLEIERKLAAEKAITQEQKEVVVTKYKTLTKTIEKRGVIKQDEKSNFNIVTF